MDSAVYVQCELTFAPHIPRNLCILCNEDGASEHGFDHASIPFYHVL